MLLAYFNEKSTTNCGQCDVCKKQKKTELIKNQLIEFITSGPKTNEEILTKFITSPKENVLQILQLLIDEMIIENEGFKYYKIK